MSEWNTERVLALNSWHDNWTGLRVAVLGLGVTGFSVADTLAELGSIVRAIYAKPDPDTERILDVIGVTHATITEPEGQLADLEAFSPDLVVVSPGYRPDHPLTVWAEHQGIPVWGDIQLAWRLRDKTERVAEWVCVTGTNGKTTTSQLTAHMLVSGGLRAAPVGNIGVPILDAIRDPEGFDALVVELSSFQLHRLGEISPHSSVVLNIADDHLDWHGSREAYENAKGRVYENVRFACVYNRADGVTERLVGDADVVEGARAVSFGLDTPSPSGLGIVEGLLIDRGFHEERRSTALELLSLDELEGCGMAAPHLVEDVLAAAALARSLGVTPDAIAQAVLSFAPDAHRTQRLGTHGGVAWIDDSKATNPHAADASLRAFHRVVWIIGGQLKGASIDELLTRNRSRLSAAVVIGEDRHEVLASLTAHAPELTFVEITETLTDAIMPKVVEVASQLATSGDTVLLSPAAASLDQFKSYSDRGERFQAALQDMVEGEESAAKRAGTPGASDDAADR